MSEEPRRPVRCDHIEWEDDGRLVGLRRQKFGRVTRPVAKALGLKTTLTVHLDPLGSAVWRAIDGKRRAAEILELLEEQFPDEDMLGQRLGRFLGQLTSQGFVRLEF